ncbi:hypothetical protein CPB84DRAFT_1776397 [Gymnopilus junonius]|uniref:Uncharacterized protein n=1 Tax=Gymnopilus junonius TaxID=109634 RepID=A0A9P5NQS4_GYMJU|nr:hypothetical protein CPB84DRAFT_1776397 [Gymnopilus junonius]
MSGLQFDSLEFGCCGNYDDLWENYKSTLLSLAKRVPKVRLPFGLPVKIFSNKGTTVSNR